MLDATEIDIEIARLEYMESSYPNYAKLADLYTIRNQMNRTNEPDPEYERGFSAASNPEIESYGETEFLHAISGKRQEDVWQVIDDLMDTLKVTNPRVYSSVIRRILDC